jgi:hypothetical protein
MELGRMLDGLNMLDTTISALFAFSLAWASHPLRQKERSPRRYFQSWILRFLGISKSCPSFSFNVE